VIFASHPTAIEVIYYPVSRGQITKNFIGIVKTLLLKVITFKDVVVAPKDPFLACIVQSQT